MDIQEWQDLHNDYFDDDDGSRVGTYVTVYPHGPEDETVEYVVFGSVFLYRDLPCEADIDRVFRIEYDDTGTVEVNKIELLSDKWKYIDNILEEAKRKMVEEI